ncbi:hypothetical protein [Streptomyces exfoliatus]|uniref:hypothetical protein n=1 Tax=Streptomyces exfoliatus TaxID=1905 RepID=UPI0012FEF83D|nr:hypothetical protein [Streptomyces exfoliatus]
MARDHPIETSVRSADSMIGMATASERTRSSMTWRRNWHVFSIRASAGVVVPSFWVWLRALATMELERYVVVAGVALGAAVRGAFAPDERLGFQVADRLGDGGGADAQAPHGSCILALT